VTIPSYDMAHMGLQHKRLVYSVSVDGAGGIDDVWWRCCSCWQSTDNDIVGVVVVVVDAAVAAEVGGSRGIR
jgi:hypothetical protein